MNTNKILITLGTAIFLTGTTSALAKPKLENVNISKASSQFAGVPEFTVIWKGNKLRVKGKSFKIPFKASADSKNIKLSSGISSVIVSSESIFGKGAYFQMLSAGHVTKKYRFDNAMTFTQGHLTPVINQAIARCTSHHKTANKGKKQTYPITIPLKLSVTATHNFDGVTKTDEILLATVVNCPAIKSPKLASGTKKEPKPTRSNPFKVKKANLKVVYGPKACPQLVILQASFETNKPGKVKFRMRDSTGKKTTHTANAKKVGKRFMATYEKSFKSNKRVSRKYMVETLEFAKATAWKPVSVRCSKLSGAGGLTINN